MTSSSSTGASAATMSFTAPQFTAENWNQERLNLSPKELSEIEADIRGTHTVLRETCEMRANGLDQLEKWLSSLLLLEPDADDFADMQCLVRALRDTPELVSSESSPLVFLRCEDFNPEAAGRRLAEHWNIRCKLFGKDRAYRPIHLFSDSNSKNNGGALLSSQEEEDISLLEEGVAQILPADDKGRVVIYLHSSRVVPSNQHRLASLRCLFYMFHLAAKHEITQKHGVVLVMDTRDTMPNSFDRKVAKLSLSYICSGAPLRVRCMHITSPAIKSVTRLYLPTKMWLMKRELRQRTLLHEGCPKELLWDLNEYGLASESIPDGLGGGFGAAQFEEWLLKCRTRELQQDKEAAEADDAVVAP